MPDPLSGTIFDIRRFSVYDGPGIRTAVFLKGCPLACLWCHNPESQSPDPEPWHRAGRCIRCGACIEACPEGAIQRDGDLLSTAAARCTRCGACVAACNAGARELAGREVTVTEVMAEVTRDIPFYDESGGGATFSGGEPLMQPAFLADLLEACREAGVRTALDTCGHAPWPTLDALRPLVDLFLYDLKLIDDDAHRRYTGVGNGLILDNLRRLAGHGHIISVRVPVIPGYTDGEANLQGIARFVAALPGPPPVDLLPYHAAGEAKYRALGRPVAGEGSGHLPGDNGGGGGALAIDEAARLFQAHGLAAGIGGRWLDRQVAAAAEPAIWMTRADTLS